MNRVLLAPNTDGLVIAPSTNLSLHGECCHTPVYGKAKVRMIVTDQLESKRLSVRITPRYISAMILPRAGTNICGLCQGQRSRPATSPNSDFRTQQQWAAVLKWTGCARTHGPICRTAGNMYVCVTTQGLGYMQASVYRFCASPLYPV